MRILALHGHGTSASILGRQLAPLTNSVFKDDEILFLEGQHECDRAPGISKLLPGPFYGYTKAYSPKAIREVHDTIEIFIEDHGPFDGILGFSQGASMALSYLLQRRTDKPNDNLPFKFAIFFSSVAALSADENYCRMILESITDEQKLAMSDFPSSDFQGLGSDARVFCTSLARAIISARTAGALQAGEENCFANGGVSHVPRVMHPLFIHERVNIPTVHVSGRQESPLLLGISALMRSLCDSEVVRQVTHGNGHDIPTRPADVQATRAAIEWAVELGRGGMAWKAHI
ncbi:hypothetical protein BDW02DRAFT_573561 [Decorospora gaudefroyi]|uniref:Serine hydrolase domain-containing protein n=1 Tax=Decorospora gaudefroyi TaxID=184978 RepID=A0A6A5JY67_9PLEO|nr:hypothetical protein BDW02DRAFT_573561 [Decorospora gaudefroyi]